MSGTRLQIDFFFKDMMPRQVNEAFPQLLPAIKAAKAKVSKINEGKDNEENTTKAIYYTCYHDEIPTKPCGLEQEI